MTVCVDASLPLAFLLADDDAQAALRVWLRLLGRGFQLMSPQLFRPEVTSAIRLRAHTGKLSAALAEAALGRSLRWPVRLWPDSPDLQRRAYELATQYNRPRAYDTQYLAVAETLGCELWTADRRLFNAVRGYLPWVRWVGEAV